MTFPTPSLHAAGKNCLHAGLRRGFCGGRSWTGPMPTCRAAKRRINGDSADYTFTPAATDEEWLQLDAKVNKYPSTRTFKAIGVGGQEFVDSMVDAVERATEASVQPAQVSQRPSKQGSYLAVSIRVSVSSGSQVLGVFREMKRLGKDRLKFII